MDNLEHLTDEFGDLKDEIDVKVTRDVSLTSFSASQPWRCCPVIDIRRAWEGRLYKFNQFNKKYN